MQCRLAGCASTNAVTGCAIAWSTPEQALRVAGFASFLGVCTIQKKARRIVIEGQTARSRSLG